MSDTTQFRLAIVVPTRNRAELAEKTIRSILASGADVSILVSDNSTDEVQRKELFSACQRLKTEGGELHYITPPEPLGMAKHWDWALEQAMAFEGVSHFTYFTDRMLSKKEGLRSLTSVCQRFRRDVVMFSEDWIVDDSHPVRLLARRWSDKVARVESAELLKRSSRMNFHPVPRMMNCVAPRAILEKIRRRFGSVFDSISPDFCFAFRCLSQTDSLLYFDRTVVVLHALYRSNGAAVARGSLEGDTLNFLATLEVPPNYLSPAPQLLTVSNAIVHEYLFVSESLKEAFPPIDLSAYGQALQREIDLVERLSTRSEMKRILAENNLQAPRRTNVIGSVLAAADRLISFTQPLWHAISRRLGFYPPAEGALRFSTSEAALEHLYSTPRSRHILPVHLPLILGGSYQVVGDSRMREPADD